MKVTRLPKDPGPAGWNAVLPPPDQPTPLMGRSSVDWLVIGAGFAGLAAARRLAQTQAGDRIAVLDAVRVGAGPAGRNSGFMIDLPHDLASDNYAGALDRDRAQIRANRAAITRRPTVPAWRRRSLFIDPSSHGPWPSPPPVRPASRAVRTVRSSRACPRPPAW